MPTLLETAKLMEAAYKSRPLLNWWEHERKRFFGTGAVALVYLNNRDMEMVVAWKGQEPWNPFSMLASAFRQYLRRPYSKRFLKWTRDLIRRYPQYKPSFAGHSGGAGIAMYLASELGGNAFSFNGGKMAQTTVDARKHRGDGLISVWIKGDRFGDGSDQNIPGEKVELDPVEGMWSHSMSTIVKALENR